MAVVLRLARHGKKKTPLYRLVATDKEWARDGRYLEVLGTYDPKQSKAQGNLNQERIQHWISHGAKPSNAVQNLLKRSLPKE